MKVTGYRGRCRLCPRQGRIFAGQCQHCGNQVCDRHLTWDSENECWSCTKCMRDREPVKER